MMESTKIVWNKRDDNDDDTSSKERVSRNLCAASQHLEK